MSVRYYLEAAIVVSDYFSQPIPRAAIDDHVYKRMIKCCTQLQCHTQVTVTRMCTDLFVLLEGDLQLCTKIVISLNFCKGCSKVKNTHFVSLIMFVTPWSESAREL
jgi:hypothetical protein